MSVNTATRPYGSVRGGQANSTPRAGQPLVRGLEVVHPEEEADPARGLPADHRGLPRAVGPGQQQAGLRARRPDHHPPLRAPVVGLRGGVLDQVETEHPGKELDRRVVLADDQGHQADMHRASIGPRRPGGSGGIYPAITGKPVIAGYSGSARVWCGPRRREYHPGH